MINKLNIKEIDFIKLNKYFKNDKLLNLLKLFSGEITLTSFYIKRRCCICNKIIKINLENEENNYQHCKIICNVSTIPKIKEK